MGEQPVRHQKTVKLEKLWSVIWIAGTALLIAAEVTGLATLSPWLVWSIFAAGLTLVVTAIIVLNAKSPDAAPYPLLVGTVRGIIVWSVVWVPFVALLIAVHYLRP